MNKPLRSIVTGGFFVLAAASTSFTAETNFNAWKHRMPVTIAHRTASSASLIPVDVNFSLFAEQCPEPEREIRLILSENDAEREIPFQLSRLSKWTNNTDGVKSLPTVNGRITFFDVGQGEKDAEYFILYGNPAAPKPSYPTEFRVSGTGPAWKIENSVMAVRLHASGQLASVILKSNAAVEITPTQTGIMHWNPGVFIPTIFWAHAFDWNPPERCEIEEGPVFVEIRRSGVFPKIRDVHLSITYRIFAGQTFVESGTTMRVTNDIGVAALRNDELVFDKGFFSHVAFNEGRETVIGKLDSYRPVNRHGDILRISDNAPFVTLFDLVKKVGAATVRVGLANIGPDGGEAVLFDNATYIANGDLQYWFRPRVYFHVDWDRKQLITIPKGSVYAEENLYFFYAPSATSDVAKVETLAAAVKAKPSIKIGPYPLPPER